MVMAGLPLEAHAALVRAALRVSSASTVIHTAAGSQDLAAAGAGAGFGTTSMAPRFHDGDTNVAATAAAGPWVPALCTRSRSV
jgi:hypothetical protein